MKIDKNLFLEHSGRWLTTHLMAVLAENIHHVVVVLRRHRRDGHLGVQVLPQLRHVHQRGLADGACVVAVLEELLEAVPVEEVGAHRDVAGRPGRVDVLQADGTVGPRHVLHTLQGYI